MGCKRAAENRHLRENTQDVNLSDEMTKRAILAGIDPIIILNEGLTIGMRMTMICNLKNV